jgi:hypothetical protein
MIDGFGFDADLFGFPMHSRILLPYLYLLIQAVRRRRNRKDNEILRFSWGKMICLKCNVGEGTLSSLRVKKFVL